MKKIGIQITNENIEYKEKINMSFAQIVNGLIDLCKNDKSIEEELKRYVCKK